MGINYVNRIILPVGQGTCCLERFYCDNKLVFTTVYDCGTKNNINCLYDEIDKYFKDVNKIDLLFISHFHDDHINGIPYLIKKFGIKTIVAPYLSNAERLLYLAMIYNSNVYNEFTYNILTNPNFLVESHYARRIIFIKNGNEDEEEYNIVNNAISSELSKISDEQVINESDFSEYISNELKGIFWSYIPHNCNLKIINNNSKTLNKINFIISQLIKTSNNFHGLLQQIEVLYKSIIQDLNSTSLLLYSQPEIVNGSSNLKLCKMSKCAHYNYSCFSCNSYSMCLFNNKKNYATSQTCVEHCANNQFYINCKDCKDNIAPGCMYTGDIKLNKKIYNNIILYYRNYLINVGLFQVPHHGSATNFNNFVFKDFCNCNHYFISTDGVSYRHPSITIINEIVNNKKQLHIVSNYPESVIGFHIDFF